MNMVWPDDKTVITRLRVKSTGLDPLMARQRMTHALNTVSLHPAGLPPSAILCIRSLRDPRTGSLRLQQSITHPLPEWERAVRTRVEQLAREAARPIESAVPANAQAVIFSDRSEFLACLAADWCAGEVIAHWWWQSLVRRGDLDSVVIETWLETPEHIPAALHRLETKRLSASFIQKLSDSHVLEMLKRLVLTFGLHELISLLNHTTTGESVPISLNEEHIGAEVVDATSNTDLHVRAPWKPWIQDSSIEQLSWDRQFLFGIALALHRLPSIARTAFYARQVRAWQYAILAFRRDHPTSEHRIPVERTENASTTSTLEIEAAPDNAPDLTVNPIPATIENLSTRPIGDLESIESRMEISPNASPVSDREANVPIADADEVTDEKTTRIPWESSSPGDLAAHKAEVESVDIEVRSKFGGICYFINLGLYLGLYSDFSRPLQPGIELPIWDFIALVAQQIMGEEVTRDPIWSLLEKLAGRAEDDPPGLGFEPPGYESVQAWLSEVMLTARSRLQLALGVEAEELARFFTQPARILVTATRLDVYFALADLPIEIRLSGLDRDPGWVPAAGKFIGFHYE